MDVGLKRGTSRTAGHRQGVEAIKDIIKVTSDIGIKYLTLYAFPQKIGRGLRKK